MFYNVNRPSIRFIGRWAPLRYGMAATAPGSYIELAFWGDEITLYFDIADLTLPFPHLFLELDEGDLYETPVDRYLKVRAKKASDHFLRIYFKSARETANRWQQPLQGYVLFTGFEAEREGTLPQDQRKTIELLGDSITEGVLIYPQYAPNSENDQYNRPYQDDALSTYGFLLAKKLNLIPLFCGYGATGVTKGGCGGVPSAQQTYPYCFENAAVSYPPADFTLINHGTNDQHNPHLFKEGYAALLDLVFQKNPGARVACLIPFCGAYRQALKELVPAYAKENGKEDHLILIDTEGWLPPQPLHPLKEGHALAAEKLFALLKDFFV